MAATIKTADLIAKFQYALDNKWGYILGEWHTKWTQALQDKKVSYMKNKYGSGWKNSRAKAVFPYNSLSTHGQPLPGTP